jgi:short-subunit dehydrogenase
VTLPAPAPGARAVVTGASSGIGKSLAGRLAARGHSLLLVARRTELLERLAEELRERHCVEVEVRRCNLADHAERGRLRDELAGRQVSVLCANAGFTTCGALRDADPARESDELQVNAVAVHELTLAVLPGMLARGAGAILVTGSNAGAQPLPTAATYAATKAFANALAEALHVELRGTGVSCTLLAPGPVLTEFAGVGGVGHIERKRWIAWANVDRVAEEALVGLERGRRVVTPGAMAKWQAALGRHTPRAVLFPLLRTVVMPLLRAGGQRLS